MDYKKWNQGWRTRGGAEEEEDDEEEDDEEEETEYHISVFLKETKF